MCACAYARLYFLECMVIRVVPLFTSTSLAHLFLLNAAAVNLPGHAKLFEDESQFSGDGTHFLHPIYADLISMLKLLLDDAHVVTQTSSDYKTKCLLMQTIAKVGNKLNAGCDLEVLDLAIRNGTVEIQNESIMSLPIIVLYSGPKMLGAMFRKLE
jgi:serine/threonine-protein kinase ATR